MTNYPYSDTNDFSVAQAQPEKSTRAGGYRLLAILFLLLSVGGLFLGLLSKWAGFLTPANVGEEGALQNCLLGFAIMLCKDFTSLDWANFTGNFYYWADMCTYVFRLLFTALALISAVLSIVLTVVSFVSGKSAGKCATAAGIFTAASYGGLFLFNYVTACGGADGFSKALFDFPTAIIAGAALLLLLIAAIVRNKGVGVWNAIVLLLVAASLFALSYPGSLTAPYIGTTAYGVIDLIYDKILILIPIAIIVFLAVTAFNLVCSAIRLNAKKAYGFDVFRTALQFAAAAFVVIAFIVTDEDRWEIFTENVPQTALLLGTALLAFLISLFLTLYQSSKSREAQYASELSEQQEPAYGQEKEDEMPASYADRYEEQEKPLPEAEPEPVVVYARQSEPESEPESEPAPQPEPAPVYTQPAPASEPVQLEIEKTEFEKQMEAIARGEAVRQQAYSQPSYQPPQPAYQPPYAPAYAPAPAHPSAYAAQPPVYDPGYYAYDPFISSLTPQEKNEFGDLFISNKYGMHSYLPAYVIGGNNGEFFGKVFIYLGRFRSHISSGLLDKLNTYVSAMRN